MNRPRSPLVLLAAIFAGWVNRHQRGVIDYLLAENRILRAKLGKPRLRFTDAERGRLARKGGPLGRRTLEAIAQIVTPDTILAWHRKLVAAKWTYKRRKRRRRTDARKEIKALVVRFASENPTWGYGKIEGAASIAAADFLTTEVRTARGLVTHYYPSSDCLIRAHSVIKEAWLISTLHRGADVPSTDAVHRLPNGRILEVSAVQDPRAIGDRMQRLDGAALDGVAHGRARDIEQSGGLGEREPFPTLIAS